MSIARISFQLILAAAILVGASQPLLARTPVSAGSAGQDSPVLTLAFNGAQYAHRWSKGTQHEFTPIGQEDLSKWQDMITLVPREDAHDTATLAALAEALLAQYKGAGEIIKTSSTPPAQDKPAEYLPVALLPGKGFFETVFVRFVLIDGTGLMALYAHRNYDASAANDFGVWIKANGASVEQALMTWDGLPAPARLGSLPQSP